jgi:hypothetical protein
MTPASVYSYLTSLAAWTLGFASSCVFWGFVSSNPPGLYKHVELLVLFVGKCWTRNLSEAALTVTEILMNWNAEILKGTKRQSLCLKSYHPAVHSPDPISRPKALISTVAGGDVDHAARGQFLTTFVCPWGKFWSRRWPWPPGVNFVP